MPGPLAISLFCVLAYLAGSIPFGLIIAKGLCGVDPRREGSRNVGATNVARLCGLPYGLLALAGDALKGFLPVWLALGRMESQWASLVGLAALLGHLFPIFLRFKGGKAVATTVGVFLALYWPAMLISGALCLLGIALSGYVSLGSLLLAAALPVCLGFLGRPELLPLSLAVLILIFSKHRENIKRLLDGQEKSFLKNRQKK
ncbi:MAG: glycerol-3-phosphate 1-O-acyltransferase PlsY [Desulfovibrionaceae bacterium]|nr:glycerol-3-phosphate 1-O-acyltransferase PlsY [Desulfovibrionaceae bacterium]